MTQEVVYKKIWIRYARLKVGEDEILPWNPEHQEGTIVTVQYLEGGIHWLLPHITEGTTTEERIIEHYKKTKRKARVYGMSIE